VTGDGSDPFPTWFAALEKRHLATLTFPEVRRALQALSALYVERRAKLASGAPLEGTGKRAAFALYYGPLHFLFLRRVLLELGAGTPPPARIVDLGCGTGVGGAAWALAASAAATVAGFDRNGWAVEEARWTYTQLGVRGRAARGELATVELPERDGAILAAFTVNELDDAARAALLPRLLGAAGRGARVLVVEPIARRALPWWGTWETAFEKAGGRGDEWRFGVALPERLALLDRAAGLDHRELTGRSLWLPPAAVTR
jgi:hypothetical protein